MKSYVDKRRTEGRPIERPNVPSMDEDLLYEEVELRRRVQAERERNRRADPHPPGTEGD